MTPYELHKMRWTNCRRCSLCDSRRNVVLVRGRLPCDVLFVGEAPGINEDTLGKPFVGPAGKLLDRIIEDAHPRACYLAFTNVIACIPYDEEGKKVSEPPDEAIKKCQPRLEEILRIAKPEKIVAVGKVATKYLMSPSKNKNPRIVTEIIHPAAILRANPAQQGLLYQKAVVTLAELFESFIPF